MQPDFAELPPLGAAAVGVFFLPSSTERVCQQGFVTMLHCMGTAERSLHPQPKNAFFKGAGGGGGVPMVVHDPVPLPCSARPSSGSAAR